ncbi:MULTISPECIES: hypothetical protein [unclassified Hyphomicrobium]|uniref:hypothetical protein n=1 Tax=unclassified Hyphomicrobium TaxID=2619925 RepID=UPI000213F8B8|nr:MULTISPECIES: hypothetical protein [unclassified Hyphomicrobium]CCB63530.1 protein of unknown function [Hyphomicrobium sp. MC1]
MVRTPRSTPRSFHGVTEHGPFPWLLAVFVLGMLFAVGYSIDNDKSLSERNGVVTQTDADNDVIPSLPPTQD